MVFINQVQDTKMPGDKEKEEEDFDEQPDLKDEEHGIEMSEDFEGKLHEQDPAGEKIYKNYIFVLLKVEDKIKE